MTVPAVLRIPLEKTQNGRTRKRARAPQPRLRRITSHHRSRAITILLAAPRKNTEERELLNAVWLGGSTIQDTSRPNPASLWACTTWGSLEQVQDKDRGHHRKHPPTRDRLLSPQRVDGLARGIRLARVPNRLVVTSS